MHRNIAHKAARRALLWETRLRWESTRTENDKWGHGPKGRTSESEVATGNSAQTERIMPQSPNTQNIQTQAHRDQHNTANQKATQPHGNKICVDNRTSTHQCFRCINQTIIGHRERIRKSGEKTKSQFVFNINYPFYSPFFPGRFLGVRGVGFPVDYYSNEAGKNTYVKKNVFLMFCGVGLYTFNRVP